MRFGIEVNTIPQGGTGEVNPNSIGIVVGMGPLIKKLFVCMVFFQAQFQLASSTETSPIIIVRPPHSLRNPDPDKFTSSLLQLIMYWNLSEWTSYEI